MSADAHHLPQLALTRSEAHARTSNAAVAVAFPPLTGHPADQSLVQLVAHAPPYASEFATSTSGSAPHDATAASTTTRMHRSGRSFVGSSDASGCLGRLVARSTTAASAANAASTASVAHTASNASFVDVSTTACMHSSEVRSDRSFIAFPDGSTNVDCRKTRSTTATPSTCLSMSRDDGESQTYAGAATSRSQAQTIATSSCRVSITTVPIAMSDVSSRRPSDECSRAQPRTSRAEVHSSTTASDTLLVEPSPPKKKAHAHLHVRHHHHAQGAVAGLGTGRPRSVDFHEGEKPKPQQSVTRSERHQEARRREEKRELAIAPQCQPVPCDSSAPAVLQALADLCCYNDAAPQIRSILNIRSFITGPMRAFLPHRRHTNKTHKKSESRDISKTRKPPASLYGAPEDEMRQEDDEMADVTSFESVSVPGISVASYVTRILRTMPLADDDVVAAAVALALRWQMTTSIPITSYVVHRLIAACLLISVKSTCDFFPANTSVAAAAGLTADELLKLEMTLLADLRFSVHVSRKEFTTLQRMAVENFRERSAGVDDVAVIRGGRIALCLTCAVEPVRAFSDNM